MCDMSYAVQTLVDDHVRMFVNFDIFVNDGLVGGWVKGYIGDWNVY